MNIYKWKGHWKYKVYTPEDNTVHSVTVLSKNTKKIKLVETIESKQKSFGDFHKVIIDENIYVIISQTVVNKLGDILSKYGIFYPIFELENNKTFYYYHVTNVLDAINQEESIVKYINDIEFTIEKLILDEKKFDGSLIFSIKNDSNLTIFIAEELIELVSKYELKGFFSDFHCSVKDKKQKEVTSVYKGKVRKFFICGDDRDYGNWVYRIFSLTDFSKKSLEYVLDELIECTENMQEFLTYRKTAKSKKSYESAMYLIRFKYQNTLIEEKVFFEKCVKFVTLHKKIL
ncbi:MAG: hypothetical protein FAF03_01430 [Epsilonproteobacteria bacterium]|nr:hypothetical protein [Campylobacterota bacterium]